MSWRRGMASVLPGGLHVLLVDVDDVGDVDELAARCAAVALRWELPDVQIRRSSPRSYHVLSACARRQAEIVRMQRELGADPAFIACGRRRGVWILRTESLPEAPIELARLIRTEWPAEADVSEISAAEYLREK